MTKIDKETRDDLRMLSLQVDAAIKQLQEIAMTLYKLSVKEE